MGMAGIVSLLDGENSARVRALWSELEREFGVRGVYATPFPHFSYHVAESYDAERLRDVLACFCREHQRFSVRTAGLGIFTGVRPVLYVPVVRDPSLVRVHAELWSTVHGSGAGEQAYYAPESWIPHITIGFGDLGKGNLGQIAAYLVERDFAWESAVDNVTLIDASGDQQAIHWRFALGTGELLPPESYTGSPDSE